MPRRRDRRVSLALALPDGTPLGTAPSFSVPGSTYWPDARTVATAAAAAWGTSRLPLILRLAHVQPSDEASPEHVTYTAEVADAPGTALDPVDKSLFADEELRMPWARPGGAMRQLAWARGALDALGIALTGAPEQVRTWNLSSLWRIPTTTGTVWLKAVPPFFAHEGAVIEALQQQRVPRLLARDDAVCLVADIPGDDLYTPDASLACRMVDLLVELQTSVELSGLRATLPDWTPSALAPFAEHTLRATERELEPCERRAVAALIEGLDATTDALAGCGIPNALVHGDFHPGNLRGRRDEMVLLDWGDSGIGHPLLDHAAFTERLSSNDAIAVTAHWLTAWTRAVPESTPARALELVRPVGALRQAMLYRGFLDHIEPSERIYHRNDPAQWLKRAAALVVS